MKKNEWKLVGKLDRRKCFSGFPTESLHKEILRLCPKAKEITQIGVSRKTNAELKKALIKYTKKRFSYYTKERLEIAVSMELLNASPCDVEDAEDYYVYVRDIK